MKLQRVQLLNFRQFSGKQEILFAADSSTRVTLIHGPNTTGKTTLLNAIYWCLYGTVLPGFEEPDRLRSEQSNAKEYGVELWFEQGNTEYIASRITSGKPDDSQLKVLEKRPSGQVVPHPQPNLLIKQILPQELAFFFFFAGEMIKKGLSTGAYQATGPIRTVLGLDLAEQTLADLREIRKKKQKELQTISSGTDLSKVSGEIADAEEYVESRTSQLLQLRTLMAQLDAQRRDAFDKLRGMESTAAIQRRWEEVEGQLRAARSNQANALVAQQSLIADVGPAVFWSEGATLAVGFIDDAVTNKKIPSPFDKTFVQDILKSKLCVCGRDVHVGSKEYQCIASLINSATDETSIRRALAVRGISDRLLAGAKGAHRAIQQTLQFLTTSTAEVERLEQEQARLKDVLKRHESQNVRELENQLERIQIKLRELEGNKQRSEAEVELKKSELAKLRIQFDRAQSTSPQVDQVRTYVELIEQLIANLEEELSRVEDAGLRRITKVLNDIVGTSTRQKYAAEISNDYVIKLFRSDPSGSGEAGKKRVLVLSSGEQRLLDLCFVSALVCVCKEREAEQNSILLPGAVAPLVVDAPFGELDPEYQALAAKKMSELSEQLVLLLSKTHWTKDVDDSIRPHVGREYILVGHRTGAKGEASDVTISVNGAIHQQMIYGADQDSTEIVKVGR